ncbi:MAG TPA: hypothetical protein DCF96_01765 [Rhodobacteraceae bacterium]|jgi:hypothetical protein|nr:hypothetical protein [Paracoccaceae bacterium]|tara:strand:+ start:796 stop:1029 length:234 start_codon:yes stop_codon:yes gene_type:complete
MGKNEKTPITVNDKEYLIDDMNDKQKALLNHVNDLGRKMDNAQFNLDQLAVGRQKFVELLADALENPEEVEEAEVVN